MVETDLTGERASSHTDIPNSRVAGKGGEITAYCSPTPTSEVPLIKLWRNVPLPKPSGIPESTPLCWTLSTSHTHLRMSQQRSLSVAHPMSSRNIQPLEGDSSIPLAFWVFHCALLTLGSHWVTKGFALSHDTSDLGGTAGYIVWPWTDRLVSLRLTFIPCKTRGLGSSPPVRTECDNWKKRIFNSKCFCCANQRQSKWKARGHWTHREKGIRKLRRHWTRWFRNLGSKVYSYLVTLFKRSHKVPHYVLDKV